MNKIIAVKEYTPEELVRLNTIYAGQLQTIADILEEPFEHRGLTRREAEACRLASRGLSTSKIAGAMTASPHTAKTLLDRSKKKLGAPIRDLPEMVFQSIELVLKGGLPESLMPVGEKRG